MNITCPRCNGTAAGKNPPCLLCNGKGWIDNEERCKNCINWFYNYGKCIPDETDNPAEGICPAGFEYEEY